MTHHDIETLMGEVRLINKDKKKVTYYQVNIKRHNHKSLSPIRKYKFFSRDKITW